MTNWLDQTTTWYDTHAKAFQKGAESCDTSEDLTAFAALVKPGGRLLDIGCGTGRDLAWFKDKGFQTKGLEPSAELRALCKEKGVEVEDTPLGLFTDTAQWDGIWCLGVFVHIPLDSWQDSFYRIIKALAPGGVARVSLKEGVGESIDSQGRVLARMTRNDLEALLKPLRSSLRVSFTIRAHIAPTSNGHSTTWLEVTLCSPA